MTAYKSATWLVFRAAASRAYLRTRRNFRTIVPQHHGRVVESSARIRGFLSSRATRDVKVFSCVIGSGDAERERFMVSELEKVGLEDAVWLSNPNRPNVPSDLIRALKISDERMTEGEFSATLKHFLALHLFLQSDRGLGLVMEDRIEFVGDFGKRLERYRHTLPRGFDILFEGDLMRIPGFGRAYSREESSDFSLFKMKRGIQDWSHGATNGANCYLITRPAARRLVEIFLPFGKVIDHHLNDLIRTLRLDVYWPVPPAVHRRLIPSTVQFNDDGSPAPQI